MRAQELQRLLRDLVASERPHRLDHLKQLAVEVGGEGEVLLEVQNHVVEAAEHACDELVLDLDLLHHLRLQQVLAVLNVALGVLLHVLRKVLGDDADHAPHVHLRALRQLAHPELVVQPVDHARDVETHGVDGRELERDDLADGLQRRGLVLHGRVAPKDGEARVLDAHCVAIDVHVHVLKLGHLLDEVGYELEDLVPRIGQILVADLGRAHGALHEC
jgi:hypothetical protein